MATPPKGRAIPPRRQTLLAIAEIDRQGLNPIEMLAEVYRRAIAAYDECRGLSDKGDAGAGYLAVARSAANDLATFKYPKLSAVAIKDMSDPRDERPPLSTAEAVKVIESDPFRVTDQAVIEQMKNPIQTPKLPGGDNK